MNFKKFAQILRMRANENQTTLSTFNADFWHVENIDRPEEKSSK